MNSGNRFPQEQRRVAIGMILAALVAILMLAIIVWLQPFMMLDLPTPETRVAFVARIDVMLFVWLGATIANVARLRFLSERDIGGSAEAGASRYNSSRHSAGFDPAMVSQPEVVRT